MTRFPAAPARPPALAVALLLLAPALLFLPSPALAQGEGAASSVRVGLGYLPDVQFAPFYLAEASGLFDRAGLDVGFQHGFASELYPLLLQGRLDVVVADAEDVIALRAADPEGAPLVYVMALYQRVPSAIFALEEAGIETIEDLRGRSLGIPGLFGSSYTSLQAALREAGLEESDLDLRQIGFTQTEAVLAGRVDAALGFVNNEPLRLDALGVPATVIDVGAANPSPGAGVIVHEDALDEAWLRDFVTASQEAMAATIAEPERAFEAAARWVEPLPAERLAVLEASLPLWESDTTRERGLGFMDPERWAEALELLRATGRVETDLPPDAFFRNELLEPGIQPAPPAR